MTPILGYWTAICKFCIKLQQKINQKNEAFAAWCTKRFGSMAFFYLCFLWSILPLIPALTHYKDFILYISAGIIQLIALPLLMVGGIVLNRASEKRAEEDHETIMKEFEEIKSLHQDIMNMAQEIKDAHAETHKILTKVAKTNKQI